MVLIKLCRNLTGLFWDAVDSLAGFFDGFYYIFTCGSAGKADRLLFALDENPQNASYTEESWDPY